MIGVTLGAFEMTFLITMLYYHPSVGSMLQDALDHVADPEYMKLISANIGAVPMLRLRAEPLGRELYRIRHGSASLGPVGSKIDMW